MEPRLILEQSQKLIMTPELRQAITVLTLPALELTNYIQKQMEENPVLEMPDDLGEPDLPQSDDGTRDLKELFADSSDLGIGSGVRPERKETVFEPVVVQHSSLQDYLLFQLHIIKLTSQQSRIGEYIIENINQEGYLMVELAEMAEMLQVSVSEVEELLSIIKSFDPAGVGASNLSECLKMQLDPSNPRYEILLEMVEHHLDDIANNRLTVVSKALKLNIKEIQELVSEIKTLDPKPGLEYAEENSPEYIMPDVVIERVGTEYVVLVNDTTVPRLNINSYYRKIVQGDVHSDEGVRKFVEGKLNSALWLIKSIEQRRFTLYKVASVVVEYQKEFLDKGIAYLVPLTLKDVAEKVGVHESTVSRAINNKYVQTPRGTFSWKFFFASSIGTNKGETTSDWVKKMIQDLISEEDEAKPLSDQKLTDLLTEKGMQISRRTVAKYREELGIPSSSRRKRY